MTLAMNAFLETFSVSLFALVLAVACDNESSNDGDLMDADSDSDSDSDGDTDSDSDADGDGACTELEFDMHEMNPVYIELSSMTATGDSGGVPGYDFLVQMVTGQGPGFFLAADVQGINLGSEDPFEDVTEAPESGYSTDDPDPVIGHNYIAGGSGSTGFDMSGDVYVLSLTDGSYAKLSVTQAMAGVINVDAYHSASTDLSCEWQ